MPVLVKFIIGHNVSVRPIQTVNGHTHDWELFVQGVNGADISLFVQKIVVNLHPTFSNPRRILTKAPFVIRESGYGGFELTMDFYFRNETGCRRVSYNYDLRFDIQSDIVTKQHVFEDCSEDLRKMLLATGGVPVQAVKSHPFLKYSQGIDEVTTPDKSTPRFDPLQEKTKDDAPQIKAIRRVLSSIENDVKVENLRQVPRHRSKNKQNSRRYLNPEEEFKAAFEEQTLVSHSKSISKRKAEGSEDKFASAYSTNDTNGIDSVKVKQIKLNTNEEMNLSSGITSRVQISNTPRNLNQHLTPQRGINVNNGDLFEKSLHSGHLQQQVSSSKITANTTMTYGHLKTEIQPTTSHVKKENQGKRMCSNGDQKMTNQHEETDHRNGESSSKQYDQYRDYCEEMKQHDREKTFQCQPSTLASALAVLKKENQTPSPTHPTSYRSSDYTLSQDSGNEIIDPKSILNYAYAIWEMPTNECLRIYPYYSNTEPGVEDPNDDSLEDVPILHRLQLQKRNSFGKLSQQRLANSNQSKPPTCKGDRYKNQTQNSNGRYTQPVLQIEVNNGRSINIENEQLPTVTSLAPSNNVEERLLLVPADSLDNKHISTYQYSQPSTLKYQQYQNRPVRPRRDMLQRFGSDEEYINNIPAPCLSDDDSDSEMLTSQTAGNEKPSNNSDSLPKGNKYQQNGLACSALMDPTSRSTMAGCSSAASSRSSSTSSSGSRSSRSSSLSSLSSSGSRSNTPSTSSSRSSSGSGSNTPSNSSSRSSSGSGWNTPSTSSASPSSDDDDIFDIYYVQRRHPATVSDHLFTKILLFVRQGVSTLTNTAKARQIIDRLSGTTCLKMDSKNFEIDLALIDWTDLVAVHDIIDGE